MNDKELCKKCIYYDDFCCRNNKAICVNNSEYRDAEMVINAIINRKEGEYIEKAELIKKLCYEAAEWSCSPTIKTIKEFPAADVQPVKHGRWEETHISLAKWIPEDEKVEGHSFYMAELKCSCCKRYNTVTFALTLNKPHYCQLCGADMRGDTECQ